MLALLRVLVTLAFVFTAILIDAQSGSPPHSANSSSKASSKTAIASKADFKDVAVEAGLTSETISGEKKSKKYILETTGTGVAIFDYDNDGWPDIFLVNGTQIGQSAGAAGYLYHNNHDGTFTNVTASAGLKTGGWGQGVCVGDYDNDGLDDFYVTYYGKNKLYHNEGNGKFKEVAESAGVAGSGSEWSTGCAFIDYDGDGLLDIVVARYVDFKLETAPLPGQNPSCVWKGAPVMCGPRGLKPARNVLYRNLGNGKFADVTTQAGIDKTSGHYCFSVSTFDYNNDGWPDIYIACDSAPNILYRNNGDGTFTDVAAVSGVAFNEDGREQAGMGTTIADYDGDGQLDIFKTNFSDDTSSLYHNDGDGTFSDVTYASGVGANTEYLGWGAMFFDYDNDGWPDLILANGHVYPEVDTYKLGSSYEEPRLLYHNVGKGKFEDMSKSGGRGITTPWAGRGLAIGDLWNNGRLAVLIANMNARPSLLVNQVSYPNHWIGIKTVGTGSNRDGIGARVTIKVGSRILTDEVRSGSSYDSNSDMRLHFGTGAATTIDSVQVRWPGPGKRLEEFTGLKIDSINVVKEGTGKWLHPSRLKIDR
jgi:enediyne biosynthesis protein E4